MEKKVEVIGLGLIVIIIFFVCVISVAASDRKGPKITYDKNKEIVYTQGEGNDVLLSDVKAVDKRDGDVSDSLIVVSKIVNDDGTAKITYAAKDENNNITQVSRIVTYVGNGEDESKDNNVGQDETQESSTPEESSSKEDTKGNNSESDPTGEIDKTKADETGIPVIKITQTEVTISAGQGFSAMDALGYVKDTYDNSGDVSRRIHIKGVADSYEPGDYDIVFTVSDTDGNVSEAVTLTLHVTENTSQE